MELTAGSQPILAIFVRHIAEQSQFYTMRGEWVNGQPGTVVFSIPRFVDADDLNDILPYLPSEAITEERMNLLQPVNVNAPRGAGARVLKKMRLFQQAADDVFRENADRITRLYEIVAPKEASAGRTYKSLKEIAMLVLKKGEVSELTQVMMWAVHRAVRQCQNIAYDPLQQGQNPVYEIYPQQGLGYILQVGEWVRKYQEGVIEESTFRAPFGIKDALETSEREQNPISTFVKKARVAIQQSRQTRPLSPSGCVGPSTTRLDPKANDGESYSEITLQSFDENERIIIHYLDAWVTTSYLNPFTNWASMGPMILRAVGMYEEFELKRELGFTLLQELGIITPWENCAVYKTRNMKIPGHHYGRERTILVRNAFKESTKLVQNDSMVGLRKDWGGMPVFCIDSAETQERDDGVSIEPVDGDPSLQWVHIHVANPSAFFGPSTALGQFVSMMGESVYFPERTYPLLSPKVTHDHFSLANNRPCLTFSAKMTTSGDIIEKAITPGILRNVHYLTPRAVSQGLGLSDGDEKSESVSVLTVGGSMPSGPKDIGLSSKAALTEPRIKMLRRLLELGEAARHRRALAGAADLSSPALEAMSPVVYLCRTATKPSGIRDSNVRQFEGDPIISVERPTAAFALVGQMVCDLMVIAGEIGASWCRERNIPIPYRGILRDPEPDTSPEDFRRDVLDPKIAKHGCADKTDLIRYMKLVGKSHVSAEPVEHFMLGLPAYCKATSPLRRYVDMYTHWQIEAALRHEASTGKSLLGSTDTSYLPFSRPQVEEYAASTLTSERRVLLCRAHSTRHWIVQALFRAFHYGEAPLPETFIVMVTSAGLVADQYHPGLLQNWDVKVFLRPAAEEGGVRMGDVWESKLVAVLTYAKNIILEPIRLMEREKEAGC